MVLTEGYTFLFRRLSKSRFVSVEVKIGANALLIITEHMLKRCLYSLGKVDDAPRVVTVANFIFTNFSAYLMKMFLAFRDVYSTFTNTVINRIFGHLCGYLCLRERRHLKKIKRETEDWK